MYNNVKNSNLFRVWLSRWLTYWKFIDFGDESDIDFDSDITNEDSLFDYNSDIDCNFEYNTNHNYAIY